MVLSSTIDYWLSTIDYPSTIAGAYNTELTEWEEVGKFETTTKIVSGVIDISGRGSGIRIGFDLIEISQIRRLARVFRGVCGVWYEVILL